MTDVLRSLGVILFIAIVGTTAAYFAQRPTIARGDVIAADLVQTNKEVKSMSCDSRIPIGMVGATFHCGIEFHNGEGARLLFAIDRAGRITQIQEPERPDEPEIKKTSDPWGD